MSEFENAAVRDIAFISREEALDADKIVSLFCDYVYIYIYSAPKGSDFRKKLYGVVSSGDFKKSPRECINTNFLYVTDGDQVEEEVEQLSEQYRSIQEFPVLSADGELLYVKRKKRHIANCFIYDWSLCSLEFAEQFFEGIDRVCVLKNDEKVAGLRELAGSSIRIEQISTIKECGPRDVLLIHNECIDKRVKAFHIDEVYLTILSRTVVRDLLARGAGYFFFQTPVDWKLRAENHIYYSGSTERLTADAAELRALFGDSEEDIAYWTEGDYSKVDLCGEDGCLLKNARSRTYNVADHQRITLGQPAEYSHVIYVFGTCIARGFGVSDGSTIPSFLQRKLIQMGYANYKVVNCGLGGGLGSYSDIRDFTKIHRTGAKKGDIVIHLGYNCWELEKSKVEFDHYFELSWIFNRRHKKLCFIDGSAHLTTYANEIAAEYLFDNIKGDLLSEETALE